MSNIKFELITIGMTREQVLELSDQPSFITNFNNLEVYHYGESQNFSDKIFFNSEQVVLITVDLSSDALSLEQVLPQAEKPTIGYEISRFPSGEGGNTPTTNSYFFAWFDSGFGYMMEGTTTRSQLLTLYKFEPGLAESDFLSTWAFGHNILREDVSLLGTETVAMDGEGIGRIAKYIFDSKSLFTIENALVFFLILILIVISTIFFKRKSKHSQEL